MWTGETLSSSPDPRLAFVVSSPRVSARLLPVAELGRIIDAHVSVLPDAGVRLLGLRLGGRVRVFLQ